MTHPAPAQVDLPGPIGDFEGMKSLVQAARLLVQAKIAAGQSLDFGWFVWYDAADGIEILRW